MEDDHKKEDNPKNDDDLKNEDDFRIINPFVCQSTYFLLFLDQPKATERKPGLIKNGER